jgi:hypothetical protein
LKRLGLAALTVAAVVAGTPRATALTSFDHSRFDALLRKHVVKGIVDYDAFRRAREFPAYLASLDQADPAGLPESERLAYWINTYNAYTIQLILSHDERGSIRNINKTLGVKGHGPWREKLVRAGGQVLHLDNVEHDIIRRQFKEPRIHFALVCAAVSCPPLRSEAYTGARLDEQLQDQAVVFFTQSPDKNHVALARGVYYVSPIVAKYYPEDFGSDTAAIASYLSRFYPDGAERAFLAAGKLRLEATEYDWTLNSQEKASVSSAR